MRSRGYLTTLLAGGCLLAGFIVGWSVSRALSEGGVPLSPDITFSQNRYTFINPLLFCRDQNLDNSFTNAVTNQIHDAAQTYIDQQIENGAINQASMYYKDLNGGPSAGVNLNMLSTPASLLKVPIAITALIKAEAEPALLQKKVTYDGQVDANQNEYYRSQRRIVPNTTYTNDELLTYMLAGSDNNALYLLGTQLSNSEMTSTFVDIGIQPPTQDSVKNFTLSVKTYASFFRILYNASYLERQFSEKILSILAQSTFTQGLVAGLPQGITVSHKFGEFTSADDLHQLHDCGIVYVPKHPYLICIMTQGVNFDELAKVIAFISQKVYAIHTAQQ